MNPYAEVSLLAGATLAVFLFVVWLVVKIRCVRENRRVAAEKALARRGIGVSENAEPTPPRPMRAVIGSNRTQTLLAHAPEVLTKTGHVNLRDWLIQLSYSGDVWPRIVSKMYNEAAKDAAVASYFVGVDMEKLQKHFTAFLMMVTGTGVTVASVVRMATVHSQVHNVAGIPITGEVFDTVINALVSALREEGVHDSTIGELAAAVAPYRDVIVVEE